MSAEITVAGKAIGRTERCFLIAEAGINHNGEVATARKLIDAAARSGADAIKFQTFQPDLLVAPTTSKAMYQRSHGNPGESQLDMLRRLALPTKCWGNLKSYAESQGLIFLSTPFDVPSAELLMQLGMMAIKVPSGEISNLPFLEFLASFGKPMLVSTGMADLAEVAMAVATIERVSAPLCLLHCVSSYPADPADANLRAIGTLEAAFNVPVGYSDHCPGLVVALAAVARRAALLEKHLTLDRRLPGPDHASSIEPAEFAELVEKVRMIESALGDGRKRPRPSEAEVATVARKFLVAARDIKAGEAVKPQAISARRTGFGLPPALAHYFVGRRAKRNIAAGEVLDFADFNGA